MPALLELQRALRAQLLQDAAAPGEAPSPQDACRFEPAWLEGDDGALRLAIYRNTCLTTLTNALRLSFPAVQRLVGAEFFERSARAVLPPAPARERLSERLRRRLSGVSARASRRRRGCPTWPMSRSSNGR